MTMNAISPASHTRAPDLIFDTHLEHFEHDVIQASHTLPILVDFWPTGVRLAGR